MMHNPNNRKGFTLIELLVVISIIGLLSSIVLASVNAARKKAADSAKTQLVRQYMTAFQLVYDDLGGYPAVNGISDYCLGKGNKNGVCFQGYVLENQTFNTLMNKYIPGPPVNNDSIIDSNYSGEEADFRGIYYICYPDSTNKCTSYELYWALHDANVTPQKCLNGDAYAYDTYSLCHVLVD